MREARITLWGATKWPLYGSNGGDYSRDGYDVNGTPVPVGDYWPVTDYAYKQFLEGPMPDSNDLGYLSLPVIAARSGGGVLDARHHELAALMSKFVKEESSFYTVTFDPPRTEVVDEYHHLNMAIDKPGMVSNVFEDYYDEPVFYDQSPARKLTSVKQLEALIANDHALSETELANQLDGMQLEERLDDAKETALAKGMHGNKARQALEVLVDESLFLPPPAQDIPSTPPPDIAAQRKMISLAIGYLNTTIPRHPDFFAVRRTIQYHEAAPKPDQTWKTAGPDQSLHEGESATATIHFRDGKEQVEGESVKNEPARSGVEQLETLGIFGPILVTTITAATSPPSELVWSRWEQGKNGRVGVFHYRVPQGSSLFIAAFCCLPTDFETVQFRKPAPFHGEIAIDPSTGAILRLTIQADLEWRLPLERSDIVVEYRPVVKGSRTFICPSKSVSLSRHRRTMVIDEWGERFKVYAPFETLLNEMRFDQYRIFGGTSTVLPGFVEIPQNK